jgi:hypothetical protein
MTLPISLDHPRLYPNLLKDRRPEQVAQTEFLRVVSTGAGPFSCLDFLIKRMDC